MCIRDSVYTGAIQTIAGLISSGEIGDIYYYDSTRVNLGLCLLYTSDAADERSSVDLGGRRIIKKKKQTDCGAKLYHR